MFCRNDAVYPVRAGQAFLIMPEDRCSFQPDPNDPWTMRWVGFTGSLSAKFAGLSPVFDLPPGFLATLCDPCNKKLPKKSVQYRITAELFSLCALIPELQDIRADHVQAAKNYIQSHYAEQIRVEDVADKLGLTRHYLSTIFKKKTGISVQEYLTQVRFAAAEYHLRQGCSIKETAGLSGFRYVSGFNRLFTQKRGITPTQWKNQMLADDEAAMSAIETRK